ncbi:MAG: response regulator transcription factor [Betaproteobacteria bacterium]
MTLHPTISIVLAEDHTLVREGLKMLLSTEPGLQVIAETGDGRAVEALVRKVMPGLLVLDLDLPGRHGVDIAIAVKAEFAAAIKVLVLTGDLRPDSVGRALAAGADGYVLKSEDTEELLIAVRAVLAGREYVSKSIAQAFRADVARRGAGPPAATATPREREIMSLVARGLANNGIAALLGISVLTVRTHRQNLMEKFELRNAAEITAYAVKHGFYDPS